MLVIRSSRCLAGEVSCRPVCSLGAATAGVKFHRRRPRHVQDVASAAAPAAGRVDDGALVRA